MLVPLSLGTVAFGYALSAILSQTEKPKRGLFVVRLKTKKDGRRVIRGREVGTMMEARQRQLDLGRRGIASMVVRITGRGNIIPVASFNPRRMRLKGYMGAGVEDPGFDFNESRFADEPATEIPIRGGGFTRLPDDADTVEFKRSFGPFPEVPDFRQTTSSHMYKTHVPRFKVPERFVPGTKFHFA